MHGVQRAVGRVRALDRHTGGPYGCLVGVYFSLISSSQLLHEGTKVQTDEHCNEQETQFFLRSSKHKATPTGRQTWGVHGGRVETGAQGVFGQIISWRRCSLFLYLHFYSTCLEGVINSLVLKRSPAGLQAAHGNQNN